MRITNETSGRFLAELINDQPNGYHAGIVVRDGAVYLEMWKDGVLGSVLRRLGWARRIFFAPADGPGSP